jgi:putative oxidoreductase
MDNALDLLLGTYPSWSRLVVRLALGIVFFAHGSQKLLGWFGGHGLKATIQVFQQYMKIPPAATVLAVLIEFLGGIAMIVGLLARPFALGLIVIMLVAIAKVHWKNGFFLASQPGQSNGWEFNFVLIAMALAVLIGGAGALSVDVLLRPYGGE